MLNTQTCINTRTNKNHTKKKPGEPSLRNEIVLYAVCILEATRMTMVYFYQKEVEWWNVQFEQFLIIHSDFIFETMLWTNEIYYQPLNVLFWYFWSTRFVIIYLNFTQTNITRRQNIKLWWFWDASTMLLPRHSSHSLHSLNIASVILHN